MSIEDLFDSQTPPGNAQMRIQDTDMYKSYHEATIEPQESHYLPTTSECYRLSMDGVLDLNATDMASTFPAMQMQSPDSTYRVMYGFDIFSGTLPSAFMAVHIDPSIFYQQHHEKDQDHHQL